MSDEVYQKYQLNIAMESQDFAAAFLGSNSFAAALKVFPEVGFDGIMQALHHNWYRDEIARGEKVPQLEEDVRMRYFFERMALTLSNKLVNCDDGDLAKVAKGIVHAYWVKHPELVGRPHEG